MNITADDFGTYRLFDEDGDLLYVGSTNDVNRRWSTLAKEKPWWPEVASKTVEWHSTRHDAQAAEDKAILNEHPRYNLIRAPHNERYQAPRLNQNPAAITEARESKGLSKTRLAELMGISLSLLCEIEAGHRSATFPMLMKIAAFCDCPIVTLERPRWWESRAAT